MGFLTFSLKNPDQFLIKCKYLSNFIVNIIIGLYVHFHFCNLWLGPEAEIRFYPWKHLRESAFAGVTSHLSKQ